MAAKFQILMSLLSLPGFVLGQPGPGAIDAPNLGFVFDAGTHTLMPIQGIPGASILGAAVDTGLDLTDAAVAPQGSYAILVAGDDRGIKLLAPVRSGSPARSIAGARPAPDRIAFSPTGSAALLYRAADALFQVVTGLPDAATVRREIPCPDLGGALLSVAVADDGDALLAAVDDGAAGRLLLFTADGTAQLLPLSGPAIAVAFRPQAHDALVASRDNRVFLWKNLEFQFLAGPDDGISAPVDVEFSSDGRKALAANAGAGTVSVLDLAGAPAQSISCDCTLTGLHRMAGTSVFRLNDPPASPLIVLDGDAAQPRVVFVPAPPQTDSPGGTR